jgi:hypothetical protein
VEPEDSGYVVAIGVGTADQPVMPAGVIVMLSFADGTPDDLAVKMAQSVKAGHSDGATEAYMGDLVFVEDDARLIRCFTAVVANRRNTYSTLEFRPVGALPSGIVRDHGQSMTAAFFAKANPALSDPFVTPEELPLLQSTDPIWTSGSMDRFTAALRAIASRINPSICAQSAILSVRLEPLWPRGQRINLSPPRRGAFTIGAEDLVKLQQAAVFHHQVLSKAGTAHASKLVSDEPSQDPLFYFRRSSYRFKAAPCQFKVDLHQSGHQAVEDEVLLLALEAG